MNSFSVKLVALVGRWSVLRLRQREKTHSVLMCGSCYSTFALFLRRMFQARFRKVSDASSQCNNHK